MRFEKRGSAKRAHTGILHFAFCLLPLCFAGCSDVHRANDWNDVFTGTVGEGYGIKARIGPIQAGLYTGNDMAGLRSGVKGNNWDRIANYDYYWLLYGKEHFDGWMDNRTPIARGKVVAATSFFPCFVRPEAMSPYAKEDLFMNEKKLTDGSANHAYWSQFEIAVGLGGTLRLGFNPGELLDAVCGYFGADIYGDDTTAYEAERHRPKPSLEETNPFLLRQGTIPIRPKPKAD
jgi:hypothetical protein